MLQLQSKRYFIYYLAKYDKLKKISFVASPFLREAGMIIEDKE